MEQKSKFSSATCFSGKFLIALLFILSGILLFARNMGWMTDELFSMIVSWHSLLIVLGIYSMIRCHYIGGIILLLIGVYFLIGGLSWLPENSQAMVWPFALIIVGVLFSSSLVAEDHGMTNSVCFVTIRNGCSADGAVRQG